MAAKSCWSTSCPATARLRWSIVRAEARRERCRGDITGQPGAAALARSRRLGKDLRYRRGADRDVAAMVDLAGRHLRRRSSGDDRADARPQAVPEIAKAADLRAADRAVCAGVCRHAMVGRVLGGAFLCPEPGDEIAGAAVIVLSLRTFGARHVGICRLSGLLHALDGDVLAGAALSRPL